MRTALDPSAQAAIVPPAMKPFFLLPLCAVFVLLPQRAAVAGPEALPAGTSAKVLVLENENTMQGTAERVGAQYRIRRVVGETWVPAERVLCVCGSMEEALAFVRSRANLQDPDERLRLARWCRANGLHAQAVAEVRAAVALRPEHAPTRRLLDHLEQAAANHPAAIPVQPAVSEGPTPNVDLTADCLGLFNIKVQPILMNTCAGCHTPAHAGPFKLMRAYEVNLENRKTLQQNLAAVLAQVNFNQPQASPLLTKAVSDHGRVGQAPLHNRQTPAYRALEDWVRLTLDNNPQLREQITPPSSAAPEAHPPGPHLESVWGEGASRTTPPGTASPTAPGTAPAPPGAQDPGALPPAPPTGTPDPFDPEEFNRQAHPEQPRGQ
jgi:hypothetical protein